MNDDDFEEEFELNFMLFYIFYFHNDNEKMIRSFYILLYSELCYSGDFFVCFQSI